MEKHLIVGLVIAVGLMVVIGLGDLEDTVTKGFIVFLIVLMIVWAIVTTVYHYKLEQYHSAREAAITEEIKKEEAEKETMVNFLKESRNDPEYRYIVDGVELQDIDENTIENCDLYRIVIDEETKTVIFTTRGFGQ